MPTPPERDFAELLCAQFLTSLVPQRYRYLDRHKVLLPRPNGGRDQCAGGTGLPLGASMRRVLLLFVLLFVGFGTVAAAQQWSTLSVDALVSMNTGSPGTALTASTANAGTVSSQCTIGTTCNWTGATDFTVGANQSTCSNLGAVQMTGSGGARYPAQSLNYNNMAHNDTGNNTNGFLGFSGAPGNATVVSALACVTLGPPAQGNGDDWDIFILWAANGDYAVAQLNSGCPAGGQYGIRIEVKPTAHSSCIALAPQGTYYIALATDWTTGYAAMWVYTAGGTLIGTASITAGDTGSTFQKVSIGNNENGNNNGTTTYFQNLMVNWTSASISEPLFWTNNSVAAGVLAPERFSYWTPGVVGGIPSGSWTQCVTTACQTVTTNGASSTSTQINSAISSAPSKSYVLLPAGTYSNATGCIVIGVSNVVLRGSGANQTFLAPTSTSGCGASLLLGSTPNSAGSPQNGPVAVTGVPVQGATTLTLASVPNLIVGNPIVLDQLDPTCDSGGILVEGTNSSYTCTATSPGSDGPYNTIGGANGIRGSGCTSSSPSNCYHQQQIVMVTSCNGVTNLGAACSGTNVAVGIYPGLHMPNWSTAKMFAWWATKPILNSGVEDLSLNSTKNSGANGFEVENCQGCWVKGNEGIDTSEAQVQLLYANLATVRNNYFFLTQNSTSVSYGVECFSCSDVLTENNIFQAVTTPMIMNGPGSGNVWGYNFTVNDFFQASANYSIPAHGDHAAATDSDLSEGNISDGMTSDDIHGTANMGTYFRNYYSVQPACWQSGSSYLSAVYGPCTNDLPPIQDYAFHRFFSFVGNVLGTPGTNMTYCNGTTACSGGFTNTNANVLNIGVPNYSSSIPNDPITVSTVMLWGNADSATGFTAPRFNCSEVPQFPAQGAATSSIYGVQFPFLSPCPASHKLPASFYYSSQPSWWPSSKPWPIIGPDVTSGNVSEASGLVYTNPAEDCYLNVMSGNTSGTGAVLSFNEASCYGTGVGGGPPPPSPLPPSNLTGTPVPVPPS
jgi:hypothetical protein